MLNGMIFLSLTQVYSENKECLQVLQRGGNLRYSNEVTSPDALPLSFKRLVAVILGWSGLSISGKLVIIINEMVDFIFNDKKKTEKCLTHNIVVSEQRQVDIGH